MRRRSALAGLLALGGCSVLPNVPYAERREWPLVVRRPAVLPPRRSGRVLLVRTMNAAPGLDARGLQWLLPDGSVHVDFYEQWIVPPAQAVETDLREWLASAGLFAAVLGPGSRLAADLVLETELTALIADPQAHAARAAMSVVLLDQRRDPDRVLLQQTVRAEAPLAGDKPPALVAGLRAAVEGLLGQVERLVATAQSTDQDSGRRPPRQPAR